MEHLFDNAMDLRILFDDQPLSLELLSEAEHLYHDETGEWSDFFIVTQAQYETLRDWVMEFDWMDKLNRYEFSVQG